MTIVLGVGLSHDASACLLVDGRLEAGIQLERLTRVKHDGRWAEAGAMVEYVLGSSGISMDAVDAVGAYVSTIEYQGSPLLGPLDLRAPNVSIVPHHLAHACSAFGASDFESAAVLVIDAHGDATYGAREADHGAPGSQFFAPDTSSVSPAELSRAPEFEVESIFHFTRTGYHRCWRRHMSFGRNIRSAGGWGDGLGIGLHYQQVATWLFGSPFASGTVMGLSPYGTVRRDLQMYERESELLLPVDAWKAQVRRELAADPGLRADESWTSSLACTVQDWTEAAVLNRARLALRLTKDTRLCMAGGVALNALANAAVDALPELSDLAIQPASSDAGLSIGAAIYSDYLSVGTFRGSVAACDSLGRTYSSSDVLETLDAFE